MITIKEEFVGCEKWTRAIDLGGDAAIVMWLAMRAYAAKYPMDGFIHSEEIPRLIGRPRRHKLALKALVECGRPMDDGTRGSGLVDVEGDGYRLHDYLDHATSREEEESRREKERKRKALWRATKLATSMGLDPDTMSEDELLSLKRPRNVPRDTTGQDGTNDTGRSGDGDAGPRACALPAGGGAREPNPTQPNPSNNTPVVPKNSGTAESLKPQVLEVFEFWKTERGKRGNTKLGSQRERAIRARLKEGRSIDEFKQAIRNIELSDHHSGRAGKGVYDDIELVCRNEVKFEFFLGLSDQPRSPAAQPHTHGLKPPQHSFSD